MSKDDVVRDRDGYRRAGSVALYDAYTIICNKGYTHPFHGDNLGGFRIWGDDIRLIAGAFGLESCAYTLEGKRVALENESFYVNQSTDNYGDDFDGHIADLFIRVDAPQMLSILIVEKWDEDDETNTREVSYCGRFSIEWSAEDAEPPVDTPVVG